MTKEKRLCMAALILMICGGEYLALLGSSAYAMVPYCGTLACLFVGYTLHRYRARWEHWAGIFFVVWFVGCRILVNDPWMMRDSYVYSSSALVTFGGLCCGYGLYYPFARVTGDSGRCTGLRTAAWLIAALLGIFACLSVAAVIGGTELRIPFFGTRFRLEDGRLYVYYPNTTAAVFLVAFVLMVWAGLRDRKVRVLSAPLAVLFYTVIAMTVSRTVMLQLSLAMGLLAGLWGLKKLSARPLPVKWGVSLLAGIAVMAAVFLLFDPVVDLMNGLRMTLASPEAPVSSRIALQAAPGAAVSTDSPALNRRPILEHLGTLNGRTEIFRACLAMLRDHPRALLTGFFDWRAVLQEYSTFEHAHNAYLQTVLQMGLPGLALALWMTWRSVRAGVRMVFAADASLDEQFLGVLPAVLVLNAVAEFYLFVDNYAFFNHMYLLLLGYAMETERRYYPKKKDEKYKI